MAEENGKHARPRPCAVADLPQSREEADLEVLLQARGITVATVRDVVRALAAAKGTLEAWDEEELLGMLERIERRQTPPGPRRVSR